MRGTGLAGLGHAPHSGGHAADLETGAGQYPEIAVHRLDLTAPYQLAELAGDLAGKAIDRLANGAGVYIEH